jgi:23S rRNA (guanosine2251-2'-O)-methyltransferase
VTPSNTPSSRSDKAQRPDQSQRAENAAYAEKKAFYGGLLTIYGRKPVLEALQDPSLPIHCLHVADSNKPGGILRDIEELAARRNVTIKHHSKVELSRISKNSREDQGVAIDLQLPRYQRLEQFLQSWQPASNARLLAVDRITNPQNLGMLIRSACAGGVAAVLIPDKGSAPLSPLVIKASAGSLFKCPILRCGELAEALTLLQQHGMQVGVLSSHASENLFALPKDRARVYVLGNETEGVSEQIMEIADLKISIPMANAVESLNVAVTAALLAYYG